MEEQMEKLSAIAQAKPYKIIISKPAGGEIPYRRIVIERKESYYQAAAYTEKQVFHENIPPEKLAEYLGKTAVGQYLQVNAWMMLQSIYICVPKGKSNLQDEKECADGGKGKREPQPQKAVYSGGGNADRTACGYGSVYTRRKSRAHDV